MFNRFLVIFVFQILLPYGLAFLLPLLFWTNSHDFMVTARQLANGSLVVSSMVLCYSTVADLTAPYAKTVAPEEVLRPCRILFSIGLIAIIPLIYIMNVHPAAELNRNGCCDHPWEYPGFGACFSLFYTSAVWFWMWLSYETTRAVREQAMIAVGA